MSDETDRTFLSVIDDLRMRLADDLDIAPDGRVFFSEATIRYELADWMVDALEGRGNGRIICYDPRNGGSRTVLRNLHFPERDLHDMRRHNRCCSPRPWAAASAATTSTGPMKGRVEVVIPDLPGYPDNINRASDGTFLARDARHAHAGFRSGA